jgi:hypothetical protein
MQASTRRSAVRRLLIWLGISVLAIGGTFGLEHDSSATSAALDSSNTMLVKDSTPENPCDKKNGDPKKNCVPCTNKFDKDGNPKKCKPCKIDKKTGEVKTDKHGNPKPKNCVMSGVATTTEVDE